MGYELTATDLQEMLHGEKVTSCEKVLTWRKDGSQTTICGRLLLNEEYKVRIAPKLKSKQPTDEACPKCKTGKLQLITAIDESKWYGCNGYPQCRFTKAFIPHTFKTTPLKPDNAGAKTGEKATGADARNAENGSGQSQSTTLGIKKFSPQRKQSSETGKPNVPANNDPGLAVPLEAVDATTKERRNTIAQKTATPAAVISDVSDRSRTATSDTNRYRRIPNFILRMLKLDSEPSAKSADAPSLS